MESSEARLTESEAAPLAARHRQSTRTPKSAAAHRLSAPPAHDDDAREAMADRELNEDELDSFFNNFADSFDDSALPDLPKMPGYHVFWATTMNPHDRIESRLRKGYRLIEVSEIPGWKQVDSPKADEYVGYIRCNEMVALKIDTRLAQRMAKHVHHDMPLSDEEKLHNRLESIKGLAQSSGANIVEEGDGTAEIVQHGRGPMTEFSI
jgi:hypothetical protein